MLFDFLKTNNEYFIAYTVIYKTSVYYIIFFYFKSEQSNQDDMASSPPPLGSSPVRMDDDEDLPPFQDDSEADALLGNMGDEPEEEEGEELFGDNMERFVI